MKHFISGKLVACDTETTGLSAWHGDQPFAFSFCNEDGDTAYFEWPVDPWTREVLPVWDEWEQLKEFFEDEKVTKTFFNAKFDVRMLERGCGILVAGPGGLVKEGGRVEEVMFMAHASNSMEPTYGLKPLSDKYLNIDAGDQSELLECVRRLRRPADKEGWTVKWEYSETPGKPTKRRGAPAADYWLPAAARRYRADWLRSKREASLCRTYAVWDAVRTMLLRRMYVEQVMPELDVFDTYEREMALWPETYDMEERGVSVNCQRLEAELESCEQRIHHYRRRIVQVHGWQDMNPDSPQQQCELLYKKHGLKCRIKTDKGNLSVNSENLLPLVEHEVVADLLKYKAAVKSWGTFFNKYRELGLSHPEIPHFLILHADLRQVGPVTGRYSCANPNLQQVASPEMSNSVEPIAARAPFGPRPGYVWICIDYSGMEIRVFADVANEETMLRIIYEDGDIHSDVTQRVFGGEGNRIGIARAIAALELDGRGSGTISEVQAAWKRLGVKNPSRFGRAEWDRIASEWLASFDWQIERAEKSLGRKNTRSRAKMLSFLKVYGGGVSAAANLLRCSEEEAQDTIREYDRQYPRIKAYANELTREAKRNGYIRTNWNRRLTVDPDKAYRAVNYKVQGSSADLLKHAIMKCARYFRKQEIDGRVMLPIHDELVFEIRRTHCTIGVVKALCDLMADSDGHLRVSMPVDPLVVVERWDRKKRIKGFPYKD